MNNTDNKNKKIIKDDNFNFLNETIIGRKNNVFRTILLLIISAMIFGIVACISFFWAKPYIKDYFDKPEKSVQSDNFNIINSSNKQDTSNGDSDVLEVAKQSIVTVVVNDDNDWFEASASNNNITSGLIISTKDQYVILTDYSTIKNTDSVKVYLSDGNKYKANIFAKSKDTGLALITVQKSLIPDEVSKYMKSVEISDKKVLKEESVQFIGNPYGKESFAVKGSLTSVENKVNIVDAEFNMLVTDISTNSNINGFLFDANGALIGMVDHDLDKNQIGKNNIAAVNFKDLITYISVLGSGKKISYLGINGKAVTNEVKENVDDKMPFGIYVTNLLEDSPAYLTGIMNGDIVISVNGKKTTTMSSYMKALQQCQENQTIQIKVMRKGKEGFKQVTYNVKVGAR